MPKSVNENQATTVAIWNPASGSAPDKEELRTALGEHIALVPTTEDDPGPGQTRQAVADGAKTVVACGGDGTVRACVDPLIGSDTALDIVPLGTGNLLAANLGIPDGLPAAAEVGRYPTRRIDVGYLNGEAFVVMAGTGFDAIMIEDANETAKAKIGTVAYVLSALKNLRRPLEVTSVVVDGRPWFSGRTSMVLVGNHGTVTGGLNIFPGAAADDGQLDVAVLAAKTLRDWAGVFLRLIRGKPQESDLVEMTSGSEITVISRNPRPYELDGEARPATSTLKFTIKPGALVIHDRHTERGTEK